MAKVKCRVCSNSDGQKCGLKKSSCAQNKPRKCDLFIYAPDKIKIKQTIKTTYTPWHFRNKHAYKEYEKEQVAIQKELTSQQSFMEGVKTSPSDCLSRFRSTASEE